MTHRRSRMRAAADALAAERDLQPDDITVRFLVEREVRRLVNFAVSFELSARNIDQPDATKYGTHPDGRPRHAPEWYVAQGIATGIHEDLHGVLSDVLSCEEIDAHGRRCVGSLMHETPHWDGNGNNWTGAA
jgi:hypothetical protein